MNQLSQTTKVLSDNNRLRILKMLQQRPLCVCEITAVLQLSPSTVSKHLSLLRNANLINDHKEGKWVICHLEEHSTNHYAATLLPLLTTWLENDPQIQIDQQKLKLINRTDLC